MGKSKKRLFAKSNEKNSVILKRDDVIKQIIQDIRNNDIKDLTYKYLNLFGVTSEELTEAGALYEEISVIKNFLC